MNEWRTSTWGEEISLEYGKALRIPKGWTIQPEIESRATGTTFAEMSKQNFRPIRVVLPPKEPMAAFTAKVAPLYAQITANFHQSCTLATLCDALPNASGK